MKRRQKSSSTLVTLVERTEVGVGSSEVEREMAEGLQRPLLGDPGDVPES